MEINVKITSVMFIHCYQIYAFSFFFFFTGNLLVSSAKKWFDCFWQLHKC